MNKSYFLSDKERDTLKERVQIGNHTFVSFSRHTGRTTAIAFKILGQSQSSPELPIRFSDHYGTREADRHLGDVIFDIISRLGLRGFEINQHENTLTFHLFKPKKRSSSKKKRR